VSSRWDETWHRLRDWTNGQGPSERLAVQLLLADGYEGVDPSHPLGGPDGLKDALCQKDGKRWIMAVYFPTGQKTFGALKNKLLADLTGVGANEAYGLAFVTNQELKLAERERLVAKVGVPLDLFHLERVTAILDQPRMASVREQFLRIGGQTETLLLGGAGGVGPGAGGGGGAAIGHGRGGDGGPGGNTSFDGQPGKGFGSGGGGAGAMGPLPVSGEGGGGGEIVSGVFRVEPGRTYEVRVGKGGSASPGKDGEDGGDSSFGDLLVARGGKGGKAGHAKVARRSVRQVCAADAESGLRVSVLLAECVHIRDGLAFVLAGGWDRVLGSSFPVNAAWPILMTVDFGRAARDVVLEFSIEVRDPKQALVTTERLVVSATEPEAVVVRANVSGVLRFNLSAPGIWTVSVVSGRMLLATVAVDARFHEFAVPCP
jgi:hypothetical protein